MSYPTAAASMSAAANMSAGASLAPVAYQQQQQQQRSYWNPYQM